MHHDCPFSHGGWVYLLANGGMHSYFKIGMTRIHPSERAEQLSRASGVPCGFDVLVAARVRAPAQVERQLHQHYRLVRPNDSREFFVFTEPAQLAEACDRILALPAAETIKSTDLDYWLGRLERAAHA